MFVFTWFFIPETKGRSLEAMDELFGAVPQGKMTDVEGDRNHSATEVKGEMEVSQVEKK